MKIVCPNCEATYEVPESVLASKRAVRCARCGNNWVPGADYQPEAAPVPAPPAAAAPEIAPQSAPSIPHLPEPPAVSPVAEMPPDPEPQAVPPAAAMPDVTAPEPPPPPRMPVPPAPHVPHGAAVEPTVDEIAVEAALAAPEPPPLPEPEPRDLPPSVARLQQSAATAFGTAPAPVSAPETRAPVAAWFVSLVVLLGLLAAAVLFREPIMKAWPASERLYDALGMGHPHSENAQ